MRLRRQRWPAVAVNRDWQPGIACGKGGQRAEAKTTQVDDLLRLFSWRLIELSPGVDAAVSLQHDGNPSRRSAGSISPTLPILNPGLPGHCTYGMACCP